MPLKRISEYTRREAGDDEESAPRRKTGYFVILLILIFISYAVSVAYQVFDDYTQAKISLDARFRSCLVEYGSNSCGPASSSGKCAEIMECLSQNEINTW